MAWTVWSAPCDLSLDRLSDSVPDDARPELFPAGRARSPSRPRNGRRLVDDPTPAIAYAGHDDPPNGGLRGFLSHKGNGHLSLSGGDDETHAYV